MYAGLSYTQEDFDVIVEKSMQFHYIHFRGWSAKVRSFLYGILTADEHTMDINKEAV